MPQNETVEKEEEEDEKLPCAQVQRVNGGQFKIRHVHIQIDNDLV